MVIESVLTCNISIFRNNSTGDCARTSIHQVYELRDRIKSEYHGNERAIDNGNNIIARKFVKAGLDVT